MSLVDAALAGPPRTPEIEIARSAFIAGNVGKLGGELLNVLLESPRYSRIAVGVRASIRVVVPKLETVLMPAAKLAWIPDDVFLCVEPDAPSFWKSAKPYFALTSDSAAALALAMHAGGATRVAVVTPLEAMLQLGAVPSIRNADELAIINAGYQRVVILRPVSTGDVGSSSGLLNAVGGGVVRILASYMTPRSLQPIRRRQAAKATVELLASRDDGVHIIGAAQLRELAGDPMGGKRLY